MMRGSSRFVGCASTAGSWDEARTAPFAERFRRTVRERTPVDKAEAEAHQGAISSWVVSHVFRK